MEATAWFGLFGGGSLMMAIGIAIGSSKSRGKDIETLGRKLHELNDWKNATLPKEYVQQRELALTLKPLADAIGELKTQQSGIAANLTTLTRWIDQHGGAGAP